MHNSERIQNTTIITMETFLQLYCIITEKEKGKRRKTDVRTHQSQQKIGTVMHNIHEQKKAKQTQKTDTKRTIPMNNKKRHEAKEREKTKWRSRGAGGTPHTEQHSTERRDEQTRRKQTTAPQKEKEEKQSRQHH